MDSTMQPQPVPHWGHKTRAHCLYTLTPLSGWWVVLGYIPYWDSVHKGQNLEVRVQVVHSTGHKWQELRLRVQVCACRQQSDISRVQS